MRIKNLKINSYGKLKNKELELKNGINVIYGKNEAGKSTILNFIYSSLYGISKNKRGKVFSDYDKYKPQEGEEFSGKIQYELDNSSQYEIYRDFNKKNPKIFNENSEEISKKFNIDKKNGIEFFYEQTNVDEDLFLSTIGIQQKEVELEKNNQNFLVQKLANLVGTGEDNVSYKRAIERINKMQLDKVGTDRSKEKPINVVSKKIEELEFEKSKLEEYQNKKYEIAEDENNLIKVQEELEKTNNYFKEIKILLENEQIEKEKIRVKENLVEENEKKINDLNIELKELKKIEEDKQENYNNEIQKIEKERSKMKKNLIISFIFLIIINLLVLFVVEENIRFLILLTIPVFLSIWGIIKNNTNKKYKSKREELIRSKHSNLEILNLENRINLLIDDNKHLNNEMIDLNNTLNLEINLEMENMQNKYKNIFIENKITDLEKVNYEIEKLRNEINFNNIELHKIELSKENIEPNLDKLAQIEEQLNHNKSIKKDLECLNFSIEVTKKVLEEAYTEMKENITPQFTNNLSKIISRITDDKYNKIRFNEENGIMVELPNGDYMQIDKLSMGTIEQLHLALRISMLNDLSEEILPLFLDETFAYYDDERLRNVLEFLAREAEKRQILIFTCSNREKNALDELNLEYNFIEMLEK